MNTRKLGEIYGVHPKYNRSDIYVISADPTVSLVENGVYHLSRMVHGSPKQNWHVQYKDQIIDCLTRLPLSEEDFKEFVYKGIVPEAVSIQFGNARDLAEKSRLFGRFQ